MREPHPLEGTGVSASPLGILDCRVAADTLDEKLFVFEYVPGEFEAAEERCLSPSGLVGATGWEPWSPDVEVELWVEPESVASSLAVVGCRGGEVEEVEVVDDAPFLASSCFWDFTSASDCIHRTKAKWGIVVRIALRTFSLSLSLLPRLALSPSLSL